MENIFCPKKVVNKTFFYTFSFFFYFSQQLFVKVCLCVLFMHVDVYILKWNLTSVVSNKKTMCRVYLDARHFYVINMV